MPYDDFYADLAIEPTASPEDIKKAFRKQSIKYHPDKNAGDEVAAEKFKKVAEAYEMLEKHRGEYDQYRKDSRGESFQDYQAAHGTGKYAGAGLHPIIEGADMNDSYEALAKKYEQRDWDNKVVPYDHNDPRILNELTAGIGEANVSRLIEYRLQQGLPVEPNHAHKFMQKYGDPRRQQQQSSQEEPDIIVLDDEPDVVVIEEDPHAPKTNEELGEKFREVRGRIQEHAHIGTPTELDTKIYRAFEKEVGSQNFDQYLEYRLDSAKLNRREHNIPAEIVAEHHQRHPEKYAPKQQHHDSGIHVMTPEEIIGSFDWDKASMGAHPLAARVSTDGMTRDQAEMLKKSLDDMKIQYTERWSPSKGANTIQILDADALKIHQWEKAYQHVNTHVEPEPEPQRQQQGQSNDYPRLTLTDAEIIAHQGLEYHGSGQNKTARIKVTKENRSAVEAAMNAERIPFKPKDPFFGSPYLEVHVNDFDKLHQVHLKAGTMHAPGEPHHQNARSGSGAAYSTVIPGLTPDNIAWMGEKAKAHVENAMVHVEDHVHKAGAHVGKATKYMGYADVANNARMYAETGDTQYLAGAVVGGLDSIEDLAKIGKFSKALGPVAKVMHNVPGLKYLGDAITVGTSYGHGAEQVGKAWGSVIGAAAGGAALSWLGPAGIYVGAMVGGVIGEKIGGPINNYLSGDATLAETGAALWKGVKEIPGALKDLPGQVVGGVVKLAGMATDFMAKPGQLLESAGTWIEDKGKQMGGVTGAVIGAYGTAVSYTGKALAYPYEKISEGLNAVADWFAGDDKKAPETKAPAAAPATVQQQGERILAQEQASPQQQQTVDIHKLAMHNPQVAAAVAQMQHAINNPSGSTYAKQQQDGGRAMV